jgi:peptide/nickel transport system ATP-binding protein
MIWVDDLAQSVHTIGNQMIEAIRLHLQVGKYEATQQAIELLGRVGLPHPERLLGRYRHELSGGMRQRVMIAMALSCNPKLLIADEPTTALDVTTQAQILDLMRDLQAEYGMAILFITHNLGVIAEMAHDVVVMYLGEAVEAADVDTIYHNPVHPYTQALLRRSRATSGWTGWRRSRQCARSLEYSGRLPFYPRCRITFRPNAPTAQWQIGDNHWARCARARD